MKKSWSLWFEHKKKTVEATPQPTVIIITPSKIIHWIISMIILLRIYEKKKNNKNKKIKINIEFSKKKKLKKTNLNLKNYIYIYIIYLFFFFL